MLEKRDWFHGLSVPGLVRKLTHQAALGGGIHRFAEPVAVAMAG